MNASKATKNPETSFAPDICIIISLQVAIIPLSDLCVTGKDRAIVFSIMQISN